MPEYVYSYKVIVIHFCLFWVKMFVSKDADSDPVCYFYTVDSEGKFHFVGAAGPTFFKPL